MSGTSMVTPSAASASSSGGGDDGDDVGCRACYGVVVACLSLLLFCVLAGTVGIVKASAVTALAMAFFGFVGWLALPVGTATGGAATSARRADGVAAGATAMLRARQAFGLVVAAEAVRVPPAFAYECAADAENGGGGKPGGCSSLCSVCLEDVRHGEAVRRLPACGHLFHRECVDMWLHSHTTCPLCRSDLLAPRNHAAKSVAAAADAVAVALPSSTNVLPPV